MADGERRISAIVMGFVLLWTLLSTVLTLQAAPPPPEIVVSPTSLEVREGGTPGTFSIHLTSKPTDAVSIDLSTSSGQCNVSHGTVDLTSSNWNSGVLVTVSAVDDEIIDGPQTCLVVTSPAESNDPAYSGVNPADVEVTVLDNDIASIVVNPLALSVSEPSGSSAFNIRLTSQPAAPVAIELSRSNNECTVALTSVSLTSGNWKSGATVMVSAVDDDVADGEQTCTIRTSAATSGDADYNGLDANDVTVTVQDDDRAGIVVEPLILSVSEPSSSDVFNIGLRSRPTATVTIDLSTSNTQCTILPTLAIFNEGNWRTGIEVLVTAVNDDVDDGNQICTVLTWPAQSNDPSYDGTNAPDVSVNVLDDDEAAITVQPTQLTVSEPDGSKTFAIRLASQPMANVTINLSALNGECRVSPTTITLTPSNWQPTTGLRVTAVDDEIRDGDRLCTIWTAPAISQDPKYDGVDPSDVLVTVKDNDSAGVSVAPMSVSVIEGGATDTYYVVLTSQPTDPVLVVITTDGQTTTSPTELLFDATNWEGARTVTVVAVDDDVSEGYHYSTISHNTSSTDGSYDGLIPADVTAGIQDNDTAGFLVYPTSLAVTEPSSSAVFTISLTTEPRANVTIPLVTSNGECDVAPDSAVLSLDNWDGGAPVTVTATDDALKDGDQTCVVQTGAATSLDPIYQGRDPVDVIVTVHDDEQSSVVYLPLVVRRWPPVPEPPSLNPIANPGGLGSYAVSWSAVSGAGLYILEQANNSAFIGAGEVYAGQSTSYQAAGLGAARYYYRAKAQNVWGDSSWSNLQWVDVLWELEPNDHADQANGPIMSGLTYYGTFLDGAPGQDYFYFNLSAPGTVELWLSDIPLGQDYNLVLRNASLVEVGYSAEPGNEDEHIPTTPLAAGLYYIQVYHYQGSGSPQEYHLRVVYD